MANLFWKTPKGVKALLATPFKSEEELEKICHLTPGRPLMERHDLRGSLPRGTFFRARLHRDGDTVSVTGGSDRLLFSEIRDVGAAA